MLRTCYGHDLTKGTIIQIFYHGLDDPTQGILDAGGIFLYKTLNESFKIFEDKVLLKIEFSNDSQNNPKPKTVVSTGGRNNDFDHSILMEKFEALARKIDSKFLKIRKELKEMRDDHRDNHASQIYMKEDTPAMIQNLERQFKFLDKKDVCSESLPRTTNTKPRHEVVYKQPSIRNENDKGDVLFIEEDETQPIPTIPNPNPDISNSPTVSPYLKDCTVHIPYTNVKTFANDVLLNHVGDKELNAIDGVRTGRMTNKEIKKVNKIMPKELNKEWKLNEKVVPYNKEVYHYLWHPIEIPHLNRIINRS
ncbi:hypothetical protein Tco_1485480 [Tanacetum coccineum]